MTTSRRVRLIAGACAVAAATWAVALSGAGQAPAPPAPPPLPAVGPWLEPDAPFFSSVLDARRVGRGLPATNLSPRAIVLPAGAHRVAFDPDLLRVAAIWRGAGVTPTALAPGSYHKPDRKTPGGQNALPEPDGPVLIANGIYPGWQSGGRPVFSDPRSPAPSPTEVGRGPIDAAQGRFTAVRLTRDGAVLEYDVAGTPVQEWVSPVPGRAGAMVRRFDVGPSTHTLWLVLGVMAPGVDVSVAAEGPARPALETVAAAVDGGAAQVVRVPPHASVLRFAVSVFDDGAAPPVTLTAAPSAPPGRRWRQEVTTSVNASPSTDAFVVDDVELPVENPWRRGVRPADIQFFADGTAAVVTLDGDIWIARGLASPERRVQWRRFASGLHEPLSIAIRDERLYVFDRNGIWQLQDRDGDGEADRHELFSNAFAQTADTREFPSTLRSGPRGEFVIAKGGQEATTIGKHNGSVLRVSADGRNATVLGYGLRQPQLAVHPRTGLVTASDQQGHYIPSTPLHIVRDHQFYGFLGDIVPKEAYPAPIAAPLTWIPHDVNASAMSQIWLFGARMGPLDEGLMHIGYNRPEVFRVLLELDRPVPQASVVSLTSAFDYPPLNGAVNPVDGQVYIAGFQIIGWGTTATRMAGLGRVRYTGAPVTVPNRVLPMREGVLLRFDVEIDPATAGDASRYTAASWAYTRTFRYGSPNFKADGSTGIDTLVPSRAYVSEDRRSVFVTIPDLRPVMQLRVGWTLRTPDGLAVDGSAYTTPYALDPFDPQAHGFGAIAIDTTRRDAPVAVVAEARPSVEQGRELFTKYGCLACHATVRGDAARLGPSLAGVFGTARAIAGRTGRVTADEAYLRQSILDPTAAVVEGFEQGGVGMPSFAGTLTDSQIDSVVLYLKSLR